MSDKSSGLTSPINSGDSSKIYINIDGKKQVINNLLYVSSLGHEIEFKKNDNLVFSLIRNEDILSIIPKREIKINDEHIQPGSMYILDTEDIIYFNKKKFTISVETQKKKEELTLDIHAQNNFPPDITQEIKVSSFKSKMITPDLPEIDEKPKKKSLLSIFKKSKIKEDIKDEKDKDDSSIDHPKSANALVRVIAVALDLLASSTILEFITIDQALLNLVNTSDIDLSKYHLDLESVYYISSLIVVFYALRVISSFVLGISFGQMLCGIFVEDGMLVKRIKAIFREILGVFTSLLLIFDLPCLIGKRTLKELLTASRLQASGFLKTFIFCLVSLVVLISVWITAPIFSTDANLNKVNVDVTVLNRKVPISNFAVQKSSFFNFALDSKNIVLPHFSYKRVGKKIIGQPSIKIFTEEGSSKVAFIKEIDLRKILEKLKSNNFVIKSFYPDLSEVLFDKRLKSLKLGAIKDIMMATNVAYGLNIDTTLDHVLSKGPFISSYLSYRIQMDQVIDTAFVNIGYKNIANYPYLQFQKTKSSSRLLALSLAKAIIIDISSRDKLFLKKILPIGENTNIAPTLLNLVDIIYNKDFSEQNLKQSFMISFDFLKRAMGEGFTVPKVEITRSFESQVKYLGIIKRTIKDDLTVQLVDKYIQNISDLLRAYKENDISYFSNNADTSSTEVENKIESLDEVIEEEGTEAINDEIEEIDNE